MYIRSGFNAILNLAALSHALYTLTLASCMLACMLYTMVHTLLMHAKNYKVKGVYIQYAALQYFAIYVHHVQIQKCHLESTT